MEREKARQRTYDARLRKGKALQVTGGKVFGDDNVEIPSPPGQNGRQKTASLIGADSTSASGMAAATRRDP